MNRLRALRLKRGLTMKQWGRAVGKTESCICQYETGIREPPVRVGRKIAMVLGCAWEELYANDEG